MKKPKITISDIALVFSIINLLFILFVELVVKG
jgi:hypothetical protein